MSARRRLRVVENGPAVEPTPFAAQFTREIVTPAGPPWRQRQVAELEGRLGAPVSGDGLNVRVSRLSPWRLGEPARFAAVYTHSNGAAPAAPRTALAALESDRVRILIALGVVLVSLGLFILAVSSALTRRADAGAEFARLDAALVPLEHRATLLRERNRQTAILDSLGAQDRSVSRVLSDLDWLAAHRRPGLPISSLHWLRGVLAIEVDSAQSPFVDADRSVQRASRPVRPGVWLWGAVRR